MLLRRKERQSDQVQEKTGLYPILHIAGSLKEYQRELVKKEVTSLWELSQIGVSFDGVLKEGDRFQEKLQGLGESFASINETAEQFGHVRGGDRAGRVRGQGANGGAGTDLHAGAEIL